MEKMDKEKIKKTTTRQIHWIVSMGWWVFSACTICIYIYIHTHKHTHTHTHTHTYIHTYIVQLKGNSNLFKLSLWIYFAIDLYDISHIFYMQIIHTYSLRILTGCYWYIYIYIYIYIYTQYICTYILNMIVIVME